MLAVHGGSICIESKRNIRCRWLARRIGGGLLVLMVTLLVAGAQGESRKQVLNSPHATLSLSFSIQQGIPTYQITRDGRPLILTSRLGFAPTMVDGFTFVSSKESRHRGSWKPLYAERDVIPDNYNELTVKLSKEPGRLLLLQFRAYDEGVALRYGTPRELSTDKELTEFHMPARSFAYEEHGGTEGEYHRAGVSEIGPQSQAPLTIALQDGSYAAILEAANVNFPLMTLASESGKADTLVAELGGQGTLAAGAFTPWRLIMAASTPGQLLEHNYIELDLNAKRALRDAGWIKPGTSMREVTLSDEGAHKTIDFAAAHHIPYILFDSGWYGTEDYTKGNATHERTFDARGNPSAPLHIQDVVQYARAHHVGVFLYIDRRQAMKQRDVVFPLYEKWGIAGVKIGFVEVGTQENTGWITDTVRAAAAHHLMLDIHDQYRTTGYTRTYPNLLTVEGIRGNEHFPSAEHDTTLPFTRYLAGSADYTICYFDKRLQNTHAHQLAMAVISYSPLQSIFWYDKPSAYHGEPEIRWFEGLPTVWDETRVPLGKIGEYVVEARRSGKAWYVAAISDSQGNTLRLPMKFLVPGVKYEATVYTDDPHVNSATHIAIGHRMVTSADVLQLKLAPRGGEAIYLSPAVGSQTY
jgi:Glycoside hydrolase 97.